MYSIAVRVARKSTVFAGLRQQIWMQGKSGAIQQTQCSGNITFCTFIQNNSTYQGKSTLAVVHLVPFTIVHL